MSTDLLSFGGLDLILWHLSSDWGNFSGHMKCYETVQLYSAGTCTSPPYCTQTCTELSRAYSHIILTSNFQHSILTDISVYYTLLIILPNMYELNVQFSLWCHIKREPFSKNIFVILWLLFRKKWNLLKLSWLQRYTLVQKLKICKNLIIPQHILNYQS